MLELNNKIVGTKRLYVALAQRKDVRKQKLQSQIAAPGCKPIHPGLPYGATPQLFYRPPTAGYPPRQQPMIGYAPPPRLATRMPYAPDQQMPAVCPRWRSVCQPGARPDGLELFHLS
ncbi:hypothetical protein CALCODRAFT_502760 [Calocera cornea HHB12733]|uniref:Uncharacterized protein n=1 Tax=Calocera cornea HHB12733 TaxID=1353952 RepID=A0A165D4D3_9BASI|nr:hypothetical protein CALCODRAFT_502760 [Calocera cornea HHB12733]